MPDEVTTNQGTGPGDHPGGGGHAPIALDGTGPGDHPGVTIVALTGDVTIDRVSIEQALDAGRGFLFTYQAGGSLFAVFASAYK